MPRKNMIYDVFVSSPGDIVKEKEIIKECISEINSIHSRREGNSLSFLDFNNSTFPDMGEYPQDVVNKQIGDFDIIIAIFWSRLGSSTPKYDSGTLEEIDNAVNHRKNGKSIKIAIYFSNAPINPKDIDSKELERLESYKSKVMNSESEFLCRDYDSIEDFKKIIRKDLENMFRDSISDFEDSNLFKYDINYQIEIFDSINTIIGDFKGSLRIVEEMNSYILDSCSVIDNISVNNLNSFNHILSSYNIRLKDMYFKSIRSFYNILLNNNDFILDSENKDFKEMISILWKLNKVIDSLIGNFSAFEDKINSIDLDEESIFIKEQCIDVVNEVRKNLYKVNTPLLTHVLFVDEEIGDILSKSF